MTRSADAARSPRALLRRFLRLTWMSRLPVVGWLLHRWNQNGADELGSSPQQPCSRQHSARQGWRPLQVQPRLEVLENRFVPQDMFSVLAVTLAPLGVTLWHGGLQPPSDVFLNGWRDKLGLPPLLDASTSVPESNPSLLTSESSASQSEAISSSSLDDFLAQLGQKPEVEEPIRTHQQPDDPLPTSAATDATNSDDWLQAVQLALSARQPNSPPPPPSANTNPAAGSGGGAIGGMCTPNAGMGGGGPTGGGGADLHLPSSTALSDLAGAAPTSANVGMMPIMPSSSSGGTTSTSSGGGGNVSPLGPFVGGTNNFTGVNFSSVEGQEFNGQVAVGGHTPTTPPPTSATIYWGDGAVTPGRLGYTISGFAVYGDHTYKEENTYTVTVTITWTGSPSTATDTPIVSDAPLSGNSFTARPTEGVSFTAPIVKFTDQNTFATPADFTATMTWGDGSPPAAASVSQVSKGVFQVNVPTGHVYNDAGSYQATVVVTDDGGKSATISGNIKVQDAKLTLTPVSSLGTVNQGTALSNVTLATLTDANPIATANDFTVSPGYTLINWGDGSSDDTTNVSGSPSSFTIKDSHTYNAAGTFTILIQVHDDDGNTVQKTTSVTVRPSGTSLGPPPAPPPSPGSPPPPPPPPPPLGPVTVMVPHGRYLLPLAEAQIALATGGVEVNQPLDFDQSPGTAVGGDPALIYDSDTVHVRPILSTILWTNPSGVVPSSLTATLTWNGAAQSAVTFTPGGGHSPGDAYVLSVQVANPVTSTGLYPWSIEVSGNDGSPFDLTVHGQLGVVVRDSTGSPDPFGAGWGIDGLDQLVPITGGNVTNGVLWVYGDGSSDFFASPPPAPPPPPSTITYISPSDVFGTLVKNSDGSYTFTDPHKNTENFNSSGYETSVVDPHGLTTTYSYDSNNHLTSVATPDGALTTLSYSGNSLSQVQEPGSRTVTVSAGTDLNSLTDAAGNSRSFGYNANNQLTSDQWNPWNDSFGYDSVTGRLTQVNEGLGTLWGLVPQQLQGLKTNPAISPSSNVAVLTDPRSNVTSYTLDANQGLTQEKTADGAVQSWVLDNADEVLDYTDANSNVTAYGYDGYGDLASQSNADGGQWQYQYDSTFHNLTLQTSPNGGTTSYALDTNTGDVLTKHDPAGTTTYTYYQSNGKSNGLVQTTTDPDGHVTTNTYDADRRLSTVTDALARVTTYTYDSAGNPKTVVDPNGHTSTTLYDANNHMTAQSDGAGDTTTTTYDAYGDVVSTTNPRGYTTNYGFDQRDLQTTVTEAVGTAVQRTTTTAYDAAGNATTVTDPLGHVTTYTYNAVNEQTTATDPLGRVTTTVYDLAGNATNVIDPLGHTTTFQFDAMNRQTAVIDALGETTSTGFDLDGNKISVTDPLGNTTQYGFDLADRQTSVMDALGETTITAYDPAGNATTVTDPLGNVTTSVYDAANQLTQSKDPLGNVTTYSYDLAGNRTSVIDPNGHATQYRYDNANRQTSVADALSNTQYTYYDANGNVTAIKDPRGNFTTYSFDPLDRQTAVTNALNQTTTTLYDAADNQTSVTDALGRTTTYLYDSANQQTNTIDPLSRLSTMAYDPAGNLTVQTDYKGKTTTYAYDAVNRQTVVTNPDGDSTTTTYDAAGNVTSVENADGNFTTYSYDALNRQVSAEDADGNFTYTFYDANGNTAQVINPQGQPAAYAYDGDNRLTQTTDPQGLVSTTVYDAAGNVTKTIDPLGNVTTFQYDAANRQTLTIDAKGGLTTMAYDQNGNQTLVIDPTGATTTYLFDALNRTTSTINPDGGRTTVAFDAVGNQTAVTDADGHTTLYGYDAGNRQTSVTDADTHTTTYLYDNNDNLTNVIDPNGNKTTYAYDSDNRRTLAIDPLGNTTTYIYDNAGRLTQTIDALGRKINDSYDGDGNKIGETWLNANGTTANVFTYTYDQDGNLLTAANNVGTVTMAYNEDNQLTSETTPWGVSLNYNLDGDGNATLETDSLGGVLTSVYDPLNRLTSRQFMDSSSNQLRFDEAWTARSQLASLTRYSDVAGSTQAGISSYTYDPAGNLKTIYHYGGTSTVLSSYSYNYDPANRLTSESDNGGTAIPYSYDNANQLTGYGTHTYSYDPAGNPTSNGLTPGAGNQLQHDSTWTYTYDQVGNQVQKAKSGETWTYSYNQANQLIQAVDATSSSTTTVTYKYDALGNQVERDAQVNGGATTITRYVVDNGGYVVADLNGNNNNALLARYFFDDSQVGPIARIQYSGTTGTPGWYLRDHLGSLTGLMNDSGSLLASRTYDPFGNIVSQTGTTTWDRFGFTGEPSDSLTGEQQNDNRWYNAATMQWTTRDPLGFAAGPNPYDFVGNDPTNAIDPTGLEEQSPSRVQIDVGPDLPPSIRDPLTGKNYPVLVQNTYRNRQIYGNPLGRAVLGFQTVAGGIALEYARAARLLMSSNEFQQGLRVVEGAFETISGIFMIVNPFVPVASQSLGVMLIGHGLDRMQAGLRSTEEGKEIQTLTYKFTSGVAKDLGASDETADTIGVVFDNAPGFLDLAHVGAQSLTSLARRGLSSGRSLGKASELLPRELASGEGALAKGANAEVRALELTEGQAKALESAPAKLAVDNPAHNAALFEQYKLSLTGEEIANPGSAMRGPVVVDRFNAPKMTSAAQEAQLREYASLSTLAEREGYLSPTGRVSTSGVIEQQATRARALERARAEEAGIPYGSNVAAHAPDSGWLGRGDPPFWLAADRRVNGTLSGQQQRYPIGYRPTRFIFIGDLP